MVVFILKEEVKKKQKKKNHINYHGERKITSETKWIQQRIKFSKQKRKISEVSENIKRKKKYRKKILKDEKIMERNKNYV